jgi:hypothetical protein
MENLYCIITGGKPMTLRIKLLLRLLNLVLLESIYKMFGIDQVIIVGLVLVVADLDSIAEELHKFFRKDCK